ncbi:MAG: hypothetical protein QNL33_07915, partial [Akkermansiaceae bacterium]
MTKRLNMKRPKGVTLLAFFLITLGMASLGTIVTTFLEGRLFLSFGVFFLFIGLALFWQKPAPRVLAKSSLLFFGIDTFWLGLSVFRAGDSAQIFFLKSPLSNTVELIGGVGTIVISWSIV